ncbi:MAG: hypothetical protein ACRDTN_20585 [Mycobacterium sp.]
MTAEPGGHDVPLRSKPIPLLCGLFVGTVTLLLTLGMYWPFGWIFPSILAAVTYPWKPTRAFAVGAFAAACGAAVAAAVEYALLNPVGYRVVYQP